MRYVFLFLLLMPGGATYAQGFLPGSYIGMPAAVIPTNTLSAGHPATSKWSVNRFGGIVTAFSVGRGGSATSIAAPMGIQLNRTLNNHFTAFAAVTAAPVFTTFNQQFLSGGPSFKSGGNGFMYQPNQFSMYQRAEVGLMYTNEERTFQISGSIGIERRPAPLWGAFPHGQAPQRRTIANQ